MKFYLKTGNDRVNSQTKHHHNLLQLLPSFHSFHTLLKTQISHLKP